MSIQTGQRLERAEQNIKTLQEQVKALQEQLHKLTQTRPPGRPKKHA